MRIVRRGALSATQAEVAELLEATRFAPWQNLAYRLDLRGALQADALRAAFQHLQDRHEVLRTDYALSPPYAARVREGPPLPFRVLQGATDAIWREVSERRFDHSKAPLWEAVLVPVGTNRWELFLCFDHLVTDGWGVRLWAQELAQAYTAYRQGRFPRLPPVTHQTLDAVAAERAYLTSARGTRDLDWWLTHLTEPPARRSALPDERPRQSLPYVRAGHLCIAVSSKLQAALDAAGKAHRATRYTLLLAAFHGALQAHGAGPAPIVGTRVPGRDAVAAKSLGAFRTTVVIRPSPLPAPTPAALVARAQQAMLAMLARQRIGYGRVKAALETGSDVALDALVLTMFLMEEAPFDGLPFLDVDHVQEIQLGGFAEAPETHATETRVAEFAPRLMRSNADLTLFALDRADTLELHLFFKIDRFATKRLSGFAETMVSMLTAVAQSRPEGRHAPAAIETAPTGSAPRRGTAIVDEGGRRMPAPDILSGAVSGDWLDNLLLIDLVQDERLMDLDEDQFKFVKASVARSIATSPEVRKILTESAGQALAKAADMKRGG